MEGRRRKREVKEEGDGGEKEDLGQEDKKGRERIR